MLTETDHMNESISAIQGIHESLESDPNFASKKPY